MSIVAVHGSYYVNNFGDTLLIKLLCDKVAAIVGAQNVRLATEGHGLEQESIGYPVLERPERGAAETLLYSGGGYFGEPNENLLRRYRWSKKALNRHFSWLPDYSPQRTAILGVGVGPLTMPIIRGPVRKLFESAEAVLVRDRESYDFVNKYGFSSKKVAQCVDLALGLPKSNVAERSGVAVHLPNVEPEQVRLVLQALKISGLVGDEPLTIMHDSPVNPDFVDAEMIETAARDVFGAIVAQPYDDVQGLMARLGGYRLVVTSKLHVGIVTLAQGGRVVSIPHHVKTPRLYRQVGLSDFCVPAWDLTEAALAAAFEKLPDFAPDQRVIDEGVAIIDRTLAEVLRPVSAYEPAELASA